MPYIAGSIRRSPAEPDVVLYDLYVGGLASGGSFQRNLCSGGLVMPVADRSSADTMARVVLAEMLRALNDELA